MYIALNDEGQQILAHNARKNEKYFCPVCDTPVILKAGSVKVPHFSHHHILNCTRYLYKRESLLHLKLKHDLFLALNKHSSIAMEYYLSSIEQIPDLLINGDLALEIQLSKISADLLVSRTEGYYTLGIKVIWLLDQREIKHEGLALHLNHFQLAAVTDGTLYSIDIKTLEITAWSIGPPVGLNRFKYIKRVIPLTDLTKVQTAVSWGEHHRLSKETMKQLIRREKAEKSVQNKTLTYMYQLGLTVETLPEFLYFTCYEERFILNSPIEWKLYIYYHLSMGTFSRNNFYKFIRLRTLSDKPDKNTLIQALLTSYLKVFRKSKDMT